MLFICETLFKYGEAESMVTKTKSTVPNLQRGMAVLEYLAAGARSATSSEFTKRLGYPSASVFRITQELTELGYLTRDPVSKRFSLTNKLLLLGQPQGQQRGLVEAALPAMRGLRKQTGETTQLCCLVETENVVLEQLVSTHPFKYSAELGARCPAYSCAPGKAMIAGLPEDEREELTERITFKRFTPTTITGRRAFLKELQQIVDVGYAIDCAEGMEGVHCVAAAVCDRNGIPVGAITVTAPSTRLPESAFSTTGEMVIEAARNAELSYCE